MTEFQKWWIKNSYKIPMKCSFDLYSEFQECWQAALKWGKAMHDVSSEPKFSINITEELKNDR